MNEIVRIHIAGVPYEIDVAAKKQLNKYLDDIRSSLGDESDAIDDIEIRITEILSTRGVGKNDVIKLVDVAAVKEQLGEPKDFSSEGKQTKVNQEKLADKVRASFADRKYFRDTENGMLGGVIAGLAAYTGWDVTLLRVLFVLLCIFTAFFPFMILYIVVWICAPEAITATDRLSMKGEPINLETIKESTRATAEKVEKSAKTAAAKVEKTARATSEKLKESAPAVTNLAARVVMGFFGVIGFLTFIPMLIALIPATVLSVFHISSADIPEKPLFILTAIFIAVLLYTIVAIGITLSAALVTARFRKSTGAGLIVNFLIAISMLTGASITSGLWYREVGREAAIDTLRDVVDDMSIRVHTSNDRVKVNVGPIDIDVEK